MEQFSSELTTDGFSVEPETSKTARRRNYYVYTYGSFSFILRGLFSRGFSQVKRARNPHDLMMDRIFETMALMDYLIEASYIAEGYSLLLKPVLLNW